MASSRTKVTTKAGRAWLRRLVAGPSPRIPGFVSGSVHMGFMDDKMALGFFLRVLRFFPCQYHSAMSLNSLLIYHLLYEQNARWWRQFKDTDSPHQQQL
jgi:hypothetical protein